MDNNESHNKQLSLNLNVIKSHKAPAMVIDFNAIRENKENAKKDQAITALLRDAERLTW
jgi:hypothetical protein